MKRCLERPVSGLVILFLITLLQAAAFECRPALAGEKPALTGSGAEATSGSVPASEEKIYTGVKISRDFQKADLRDVIRSIGGVSGKNIVIPDGLCGKITLKLTDVPWDQALDAVLSPLGLVLEESGNVLMIYDLATFRKLQADRARVRDQIL